MALEQNEPYTFQIFNQQKYISTTIFSRNTTNEYYSCETTNINSTTRVKETSTFLHQEGSEHINNLKKTNF